MNEEKVLLVDDKPTDLQIDYCFVRTASRKGLLPHLVKLQEAEHRAAEPHFD